MSEIERMKREAHPMQAKKELAARIVQDSHAADAASKAAEDWAKQFQKDEIPEDIEEINVSLSEVQWQAADSKNDPRAQIGIHLDRLLLKSGLADSVTDANRKLKQNAVKVNSNVERSPRISLAAVPTKLTVKAGKRMKVVVIIE